MPITQDRLKKLADAAQSVIATYIGQCATLGEFAGKFRAGELSIEELLQYVESRAVIASISIASEMTIVNTELYRWQFSHNKNTQEARRVARRREERKTGLRRGELTPNYGASVVQTVGPQTDPKEGPSTRVHDQLTNYKPDFDGGLDLTAEVQNSNYIPKELSPEIKAEIEKEMDIVRLAAEVSAKLGLSGDAGGGE